ncbi:uncharacterized protein LOC128278666 [Anopheles cruzii]|uniref:uncharacterized protein LOC128278666 n=1 Tax=Anopheles cruzii TaxID=68878 RepID=UPI0022EC7E5A|nr:uncharacterized protein LOC128278666 [Anopheles cruzii]
MSSNEQGNKPRASQEEAGPSKPRSKADPEAGPSSTRRVRSIDRYYEYHSDSESELDADELEADRRVFNSAAEQERHTAAELTRHLTLITQQSPEHGSAMLKQTLCMLGPYFPGMPKDPRTALKGPWHIEPLEVDGGLFWYRGFESGILENVASDTKEVKFDVHVGVAPLPQLTSPELKTWVIQARLHEATKPPGEPFVVAVFCGNSRPTCEELLGPFSEKAARLCESPLTVNGDSLTVKPRVVISDDAERAFIKGTVNQSSCYGCPKCTIKGELVFGSTMTFFGQPNTTYTRRTNEEFRCGVYASTHQKVVTPLARLPIDLVQDVIVGDNRNLLHLGVMKNLYSVFVKGAANVPEMDGIGQVLLQLVLTNVEFPHERRTTARHFNTNITEWSPSMWGYFLDVVGIVVLGQVGQPACYEMYCLLHWGVAICNHSRFSSYLNAARRVLQQYVTKHNDLVGSVTCNFHHLLHLVDEVRRFGPLPLQSSNPFEAELSVLRHEVDLAKAGSPVQQVATALLLRERTRYPFLTNPLPVMPIPTNNGRRVKIRKNFLLKNSANDTDSWFLVPGSGSSCRGQVVKFVSARADPFVVCGTPLTEQRASGNNPFADPIGLDVFITSDKHNLQSTKEYSLKDMVCKLCVVWMPTYISFVPLPESFAES